MFKAKKLKLATVSPAHILMKEKRQYDLSEEEREQITNLLHRRTRAESTKVDEWTTETGLPPILNSISEGILRMFDLHETKFEKTRVVLVSPSTTINHSNNIRIDRADKLVSCRIVTVLFSREVLQLNVEEMSKSASTKYLMIPGSCVALGFGPASRTDICFHDGKSETYRMLNAGRESTRETRIDKDPTRRALLVFDYYTAIENVVSNVASSITGLDVDLAKRREEIEESIRQSVSK